ncbi:FkbM family methyltransferase [Oscillospiraceae bacterium 38-13]
MKDMNTKILREELAQALSRKFDDSRKIAVYGAGNSAERWFSADVEENGCWGDIVCFIDDTPSKQGTYFHGKPIVNAKEAHELCKGFIILICSDVTRTRRIIGESLRRNPIEGAENFTSLDEYVFCRHSAEVLAVYDMLEDDLSKHTYANMILLRMMRCEQDQTLVRDRSYYAVQEFTAVDPAEVYVDCGAYTGDTLDQYLTERQGQFGRIFAFEPSESNFRELTRQTAALKQKWKISSGQIELVQAGIGDKTQHLKPAQAADGIDIGYNLREGEDSTEGVCVYSVDDYFREQTISFLKADIEGFECKMLRGAKRVLQRDMPKMAICIYHSAFDMYRVALKVKEINPKYKLSVRQHSNDILDTVLYAYL